MTSRITPVTTESKDAFKLEMVVVGGGGGEWWNGQVDQRGGMGQAGRKLGDGVGGGQAEGRWAGMVG